jgi:hypothetical protein|tara:strand:+ start:1487 stop:1753 length:267 start_codon:yes stop_codon:yes gene_type:complete
MYSRTKQAVVSADKNPNRVLGGLKGQGVNSFSMLGEDGTEKQIPTQAYVMALEDKMRKLELQVNEQDKRIRRITNDTKRMDQNPIRRT